MKILTIFNPHERFALNYLKQQGLKLITKNYLSKHGEIDLIMKDEEYLIFIEVRYRKTGDYGNALESILPSKQRKITRTAQHFLTSHPAWAERPLRFDIFAITGTEIDWIQAAFQ